MTLWKKSIRYITPDDPSCRYGRHFQIRADYAVTSALFAFCRWGWKDPEQAIIEAVGLGGDTDTIACMTGALCGAFHGHEWIPKRWLDEMENEPETGRDSIIKIAESLSLLDIRSQMPHHHSDA